MIPRRWKPGLVLSRFLPNALADEKPTKYVLFAKQRSGSTWIIDLLNSHRDVVGYSELFDYECWGKDELVGGKVGVLSWNSFVADFHAEHNREPNRAEQVSLYPAYLHCVLTMGAPSQWVKDPPTHHKWRKAGENSAKAVGFKLMYNQAISHPAIPRYLQNNNVHCIHLIRRNHLDGIVSHEAVANRGFAHAGKKADAQATKIDAASIVMRIKRRAADVRAGQEFARFLRLPTIEIFYEDLKEDLSGMSQVLEFLGVDPSPERLKSKLKKMSSNSHRDTIANYDEVAAALKGTEFESLLRP